MKNILSIALVALLVASCTTTKYQTVYKYADRPEPIEPSVNAATMKPVQWKVLTKNELDKTLKDLEANPDPNFVLIALTPKGYENLSSNLVELNRYIREQRGVITYYKGYVKNTQAAPETETKK